MRNATPSGALRRTGARAIFRCPPLTPNDHGRQSVWVTETAPHRGSPSRALLLLTCTGSLDLAGGEERPNIRADQCRVSQPQRNPNICLVMSVVTACRGCWPLSELLRSGQTDQAAISMKVFCRSDLAPRTAFGGHPSTQSGCAGHLRMQSRSFTRTDRFLR